MATAFSPTQPRIQQQPQQRKQNGHGISAPHINVDNAERWFSVLGGGALALYGLARRDLGGLALALGGGLLIQRGWSGHCMMYEALGFDTAHPHPGPATSVRASHGYKLEKSVTINASPEKLFSYWRNLENLPRFMKHIKSVRNTGGNRSHWEVEGPLGKIVEWDAEIINEKPNEMIAWRSLEGAEVDNAGSVHFTRAPGGRGTEVHVTLKYEPPMGKVGATVAWLFGRSPEQEIQGDLGRFKQIMEAGETATVQGQTSGRR